MEWLLEHFFQIATFLSVPITWFVKDRFFTKRDLKDRDVNTESNQSEIVSKNLELYQRMLDDIEKRYEERIFKSDTDREELEAIIKELKITIKELEEIIYDLEAKSKRFTNEIINLKQRLKEYEENK